MVEISKYGSGEGRPWATGGAYSTGFWAGLLPGCDLVVGRCPAAPGGLVSSGFWAGLLPGCARVGYCARPPLPA